MLLSIVITTRNRIKLLRECIESIEASELSGISYEIIVVDDASSDETENLSIDGVKVIHNAKQLMMAKSRNVGARKALGELILFIDDDNIVDKKMIAVLVKAASNYPEYGILGPSMYLLEGKKRYLDYQRINLYTGKTTHCLDYERRELCDSDGIPNVFMVRKEVFEKCGYFDEKMQQSYTEPDLFFGARRRGFKCGMIPKAKTYHNVLLERQFTPRNLGGMYLQKAYCLMRNRSVIVARYGNFLQKLVYLAFFSWLWPLFYSLLMLRYFRFDLIKLYWKGFLDGVLYFATGRLKVVSLRI